MQRDDRYRKIIHENEYVLKMQNEVLPYLARHGFHVRRKTGGEFMC